MDLRRLRLFLAVVDEGGFTAAASVAGVAQPAVSLAVRELEEEVGAALVVRSRQGASLTTAGEALVGPARQALREVDNGIAAVAAVTGLVAGHLDLAPLPTLAADPVADLVGRFRQSHPGVTVRVATPDDVGQVAEWVRSGAVELGFTEPGPVNRGLIEVDLVDQELHAVSPAGAPVTPLDLDRVADEPLVLTPRGSWPRDLVDAALSAAGAHGNVAVETTHRDALIPLVLAGAGTTFLPAGLAETARPLGAVVRPTVPSLRRAVVLVHRPGEPSPAAHRFRDLAAAGRPRPDHLGTASGTA